jgi:hypothetical protein
MAGSAAIKSSTANTGTAQETHLILLPLPHFTRPVTL